MKKTSLLTNEKGSVVVLALIMVVVLTLMGMAVTRTSSIEVQVASNDRQAVENLYMAESADHYAIEVSQDWLSDDFLADDEDEAFVVFPPFDTDSDGVNDIDFDLDGDGINENNFDLDGDGINDVLIEIRCIKATEDAITGLSDDANDLPTMQHITVPPAGSGYSLKYFEVRRYGITGTTSDGGTVVQLGAYKVFNKY